MQFREKGMEWRKWLPVNWTQRSFIRHLGAEKVLRAVMRELPQAPVEELIRAALKRL